ncbi:unnamed protein product, partial [Ectocarpus sp. 6 AP-2014]
MAIENQAWIGSSGVARPRRLPAPRQKSRLLIPGRYCRPSGRGHWAGSLAEGSRGDGGGGGGEEGAGGGEGRGGWGVGGGEEARRGRGGLL